MSEPEIKELLSKGFNPASAPTYRAIYKTTFNKDAPSCACNNGKIYQDLKEHFKIK